MQHVDKIKYTAVIFCVKKEIWKIFQSKQSNVRDNKFLATLRRTPSSSSPTSQLQSPAWRWLSAGEGLARQFSRGDYSRIKSRQELWEEGWNTVLEVLAQLYFQGFDNTSLERFFQLMEYINEAKLGVRPVTN